ncbi:hypothetical protein V1506DRAFT_534888 [Lipomyces tetrasporus]
MSSAFSASDLARPPIQAAAAPAHASDPVIDALNHADLLLLSDSASTSSASSAASVDTALTVPDSPITKAPFDQAMADAESESCPSSGDSTPTGTVATTPTVPVTLSLSAAPDVMYTANDDSVIQYEPSRHVDYLSHNWQESDISSSWRYIVLRRKDVANSARLENASWRTWTKAKYNLKTVSPESVNWLKDYDVTWLYGPLYTPSKTFLESPVVSSPSVADSTSRSAGVPSPPVRSSVTAKKPILKKRSVSEVMLSRSVSSSNLLKQAAASVKAQRHLRAPGTKPTTVSYSSSQAPYTSVVGPERPDPRFPSALVARSFAASSANFSDRLTLGNGNTQKPAATKHIHFSDRVEQCIALEAKDEDDDTLNSVSLSGTSSATSTDDEDADEDEPGLFLMVRSGSGSFQRPASLEPHTIAKLPATKLKYVHEPDEKLGVSASSRNPSASFSMGDDEDDEDVDIGHEAGYDDDEVDYFSRNHYHYHRHQSSDTPHNRYEETTPTGSSTSIPQDPPLLPSRSSTSNLASSSSTSFASKSPSSNFASRSSNSNLAGSVSQPHTTYLEDSSSSENRHPDLASDSDSDTMSDDGDVVDMDSSLIASLRRDSVVLARGRINDILPSTSITDDGPSSEHADHVYREEDFDDVESTGHRPISVHSNASSSSVPIPPKVDSEDDDDYDGEMDDIQDPEGFWGHINHAVTAAKDLATVFWNGGWRKST